MTQYKLFTSVDRFYGELVEALNEAEHEISMMYFTFDEGKWARLISAALSGRVEKGVRVRLMIDEFGMQFDHVRNCFINKALITDLRAMGIQVDLFKPKGHRLSFGNRLHTKICAIDDKTTFIGGSNIGDYYTTWDDANLRLDGNLGRNLHELYDFIHCHSENGKIDEIPSIHLSHLVTGDAKIWLTVPKQRRDIRRELLKIILDAETDIYIRNWYFLPDREILDALRSQAERGVNVNVLLSDKTRVRAIDFANWIHGHKLAKSGGKVFRYTHCFMHAKVAWNDRGEVLFGSANMDKKALRDNFECSLSFKNKNLTNKLRLAFEADKIESFEQKPGSFARIPVHRKIIAYACNSFSSWL